MKVRLNRQALRKPEANSIKLFRSSQARMEHIRALSQSIVEQMSQLQSE